MLRTAVANKKYFVTVFVVSCLLLAVFTSILYRQYRITQSYANWVSHSYEVLRHAQRMFIYILDVETGQRGYILSGSEKFLQPYNSSIEKLDGELESLISITADNPAQQSNLILLRDKINKLKKALSGQMLKYGARGGKGIRVEDLRLSQRLMNDVRTAYHNFVSEESITLQSRLLTADKEQRRYLLTLFIGSLLAVMGLIMANLLIFYLMARNRQTIENLRESEKRFAMVMNGINDGIFEYDLNNNKFYFSPNCKAMLGYADHELPNTREGLNELLHPEDYHATQETFQLYIDRKIPTYKNIFRMRHKDGTWRWILSRGVGVGSNKKRFDRLIGAHTDITEHKEREKEFERLNADLQSFTYMASHDLRAPLVNLKGFANEIEYTFNQIKPVLQQYASRLQDKEKEIVTQAFERDLPESLVFVRSAVEKMDKLTAAILDLSRVGGREYDLVPVDTNSLVKNCIDAFRYEISSHNIKVECENLPEVVTDHLSLEQIFSNVIDNAIKYRDSARVSEIKIGAKKAAGETIFYIKDNGRGIAEVDQRKVFDIFRRASNAGNVRGIGMGMPYVQAVLRKLGGRIWFQSTLGEGATFYFSIPQKQAATIKYDKAA